MMNSVSRTAGVPACFRRNEVSLAPGIALCLLVTGVAYALAALERAWTGRAWLEALVLAILCGTVARSRWTPARKWRPGIAFCAKYPLELAILLLGASVSDTVVRAAGPALLVGIAAVVAVAILLGFGIGRLCGVPARMALLVACGNAICGNSAIAAIAPVIAADDDEIAASIAFTALFGVVVVLGLPLLGILLGMEGVAYGALAGLTVYAVPQVMAAAAPMGTVAIQMGMLVKLARVLMLGPVCLVLSVLAHPDGRENRATRRERPPLVPWFLVGFLALAACRLLGLVPDGAVRPLGTGAAVLTVLSMAALGLGADLRTVMKAGGRVMATVVLSLLVLTGLAVVLIGVLRLAQ
ncbi:putative sulfate exporter family transporter [Gluconacetobacter aggeris]|uniref:Putative sulfate exporter family transporter n=1 Tax=Gluconacetobacter aggeris TaxID=1286186 RepID=A0A7W4IRU7_9PROT|nr:putative sulfate exporter family transporter [Gluconacetobacter aggeris]